MLPVLADWGRTTVWYETKANLSRDQVRTLAEARVNRIQPGIESLSDKSLRLMRKGSTKAVNLQLLRWCAEYGVGVSFTPAIESNYTIAQHPVTEEIWVFHIADAVGDIGVINLSSDGTNLLLNWEDNLYIDFPGQCIEPDGELPWLDTTVDDGAIYLGGYFNGFARAPSTSGVSGSESWTL